MPSIARGQENTVSILNWFTTVNGISVDMNYVGYQIYDITGGIPGTQIFPATAGQFENVTNAPGRFSVGAYYAYDNSAGTGWTPELTASIGDHRIVWAWKVSANAQMQSSKEDFCVFAQNGGAIRYITVADVRSAGLTDTTKYTDADILAMIEIQQTFLDRACRQWFRPISTTMNIDGTDSSILPIGVPIISIDYVKLNDSTSELSTDYYKVYNSISYPDDRKNPRIKLINSCINDIFSQNQGQLIFRKGVKNQEIKGVFGYLDESGNTPKLIKRALLKLVIEKLANPVYGTKDPYFIPLVGSLIEEWTDGHKVKYSESFSETKLRQPGLYGITKDQEVLGIIKLFKGPFAMAYPVNPSIG
jgi:hypothetical protein